MPSKSSDKSSEQPVETSGEGPVADMELAPFMYPNLGDAPVTIMAATQAEADAKAAKLKADMEAQKAA